MLPGAFWWILAILGLPTLAEICKVYCKKNYYDNWSPAFIFVTVYQAAFRDSNYVHVLLLFGSTAGLFWEKFFFCLNLLEIVSQHQTLKAVNDAIANSYVQLLWTFGLLIVVIWAFALFGFTFMQVSDSHTVPTR